MPGYKETLRPAQDKPLRSFEGRNNTGQKQSKYRTFADSLLTAPVVLWERRKTFTNIRGAMHNPIRILFVDDSPHFLEVALTFLHLHQPQAVVETATHAQEAVEKSRHLEPDVILLDLNLGDRFWLDLIPHFREHLRHSKIIILSIMNGDAYRAASLRAGADAFVDKFGMNQTLVPVILQQLDRSAREQRADQPPETKLEQLEIEDNKESGI